MVLRLGARKTVASSIPWLNQPQKLVRKKVGTELSYCWTIACPFSRFSLCSLLLNLQMLPLVTFPYFFPTVSFDKNDSVKGRIARNPFEELLKV